MKKIIILIMGIFLCISLIGAELIGNVRVENMENFGVFVYVLETGEYDITDELGNFKIKELKMDNDYTLIFQKENLNDVRKKLSVKKNIQYENYILRQEQEKTKYKLQILLSSSSEKDGYLKIDNFPYGILLKSNKYTLSELEAGKYSGEVMQEGSFSKKINFEIKEIENNNLGVFSLQTKTGNIIKINLNDPIDNGYLILYKDDELKYIEKIKEIKKNFEIKNLETGKYKLEIKTYGKENYEKVVSIKENNQIENLNITLKKLSDLNNIVLDLYPNTQPITIKIYSDDGILLKKETGKNGLHSFSNLDWSKKYDILIESEGYKNLHLKSVGVGEKIDVAMVRDIKGVRVSGTVYPFNSMAEVMLLDDDKIIAKTVCDEYGNYELESDENQKTGRKIIKVRAKNFKEYKEYRTLYKNTETKNVNIDIEPLKTSLYGRINNTINDYENLIVTIEELGMWQYANKNGRYYFADIPRGIYNISYKKLGYTEVREKVYIEDKEIRELNIELNPETYIFVKSNVNEFEISINDKKEFIKDKKFEKKLMPGEYKITFYKKDYITITENIRLIEAGEIKEINLIMKNIEKYKLEITNYIEDIKKLIELGEIREAELHLDNLKKDKDSVVLQKDIDNLYRKIRQIRDDTFDLDRKIRQDIIEMNKSIIVIENEDLTYGKKRKKLDNKYKECIEYSEKILLEKKYTEAKYEIYNFIGDLYIKLGMDNSARENHDKANRYKKLYK